MLKAFILAYIGAKIDAGFWYYAAGLLLCVADVVSAWLSEREEKQ